MGCHEGLPCVSAISPVYHASKRTKAVWVSLVCHGTHTVEKLHDTHEIQQSFVEYSWFECCVRTRSGMCTVNACAHVSPLEIHDMYPLVCLHESLSVCRYKCIHETMLNIGISHDTHPRATALKHLSTVPDVHVGTHSNMHAYTYTHTSMLAQQTIFTHIHNSRRVYVPARCPACW